MQDLLVNTPGRYYIAIDYLRTCIDNNETLEATVDTETTGLEPWFGSRLCGIAIEVMDRYFYFPFRHGIGMGEINLPLFLIRDFDYILSQSHVTYRGHNYKFDMQILYVDGIPMPTKIEDTQLAAHLMNENEYDRDKNGKIIFQAGKPKTMFRLKELMDRYLGPGQSAQEYQLINRVIAYGYAQTAKEAKGNMWRLPAEGVWEYAIQDIRGTKNLKNFYEVHLKNWKLYDLWLESNEVEIAATWMEIYGFAVDVPLMKQYMEESKPKAQEYLAKLQEIAGYAINPRSNPQMATFMGMKSTKKEMLEVIRDSTDVFQNNPNYTVGEVVKILEAYRAYEKVNVNYYDKFLNKMDVNGNLHTNIFLTGTVSGRWSMGDPPMQAIPVRTEIYKVKDVLVARPGFTLVEADQSQAEIRLANHYTKDPVMREKILRGADSHGETAQELNIPRNAAKRMNFSCIYGIGAPGLSKSLHITEKLAAEYLSKYHGLYKGFRALAKAVENMANLRGYIRLWTGRVRRYDKLNPTHKAMSNLIQGAVAEIIRVCILRAWRQLVPQGVRLLLQVHDSIIFEVPDEILFNILPQINHLMTDFNFEVPLKVDIKYGKSWGGMQKWEIEEVV